MTKVVINTGLFPTYSDSNFMYDEPINQNEYKIEDYSFHQAAHLGWGNAFVLGESEDAYLHFVGLEVFDRYEDATKGQKVSIFGGEIVVRDDLTGNPSGRRGGLILYFNNENGPDLRLKILQHKGQTYAEFSFWDGKKPEIVD